jgi:hypothetical protein
MARFFPPPIFNRVNEASLRFASRSFVHPIILYDSELPSLQYHIISPTHFYSNIRILTTMPTLRLVHLTEQQYADAGAANTTTTEEQLPSTILREHTRLRVVDAVQQFQHEMVSSDEESENSNSTPSAQVHVDAVQQKSGNKRKRSAPIQQSFDDRCFNDLMVFKAKYGHSLGQWCSVPRVSCNQIQNNQMPQRMKLSELSTGIVAPPGMSIKDSTSTRSRNLLLSIKHMNTRGLSDSMKRSVRSRNLVNEAANTRTSYSQHMGVLLNSLERRTKEQYDAL